MASSLKLGFLFETAFHKSAKETDELLDPDIVLGFEKDIIVEEFDRNTELWTSREVVLAAKVLSVENPKKHGVKFATDNQMRRVYDIIFEIFRCETLLSTYLHLFFILICTWLYYYYSILNSLIILIYFLFILITARINTILIVISNRICTINY